MTKGQAKGFVKKLSVRTKLILFMTTTLVITSVFNLYFYYKAYIAMDEYNYMLKDYANVNNLSIDLIRGRECISRYISTKNHTELDLYVNYKNRVNYLVNTIYLTSNTLDTYLWSRAIKNAVASYNEEINKTIQTDSESENFFAQYVKANSISIYIENYIKQLLNTKLTEGEWYHQKLRKRVEFVRLVNLISVIGITVFSIIYVFMLSRNITEPIKKLTSYSMNIAKGDFNLPKLEIDSSDDINILALAFNKMTLSIQHMITEITEKSNIERKLHEEELKNLKISEQLNEAKFLALQSQINPHFLFNTLNAIMRMSMFEKARKTTNLIESLSNIFRYNLSSFQKDVLLIDELAVVKEYIFIQQARFGSRINFSIVCKDDISNILIPRFVIQPLVENAIVHGVEPKETGGAVRVKIYKRNDRVIIKIIDNGVGIPKEVIEQILAGSNEVYSKGQTTGIGINNVKDRLAIFYKDPNCFNLRSKNNLGTVLIIRIPIIQEYR